MNKITREALRKHNYCMGMQIASLIEALGMHWENQKAVKEGKLPPYTDRIFKKLLLRDNHILTHKGIISQWQGVE